jgi:hypothetical protein
MINVPQRNGHLDTRPSVGGAIWMGLGDMAFLEEVCHWGSMGWGSEFKDSFLLSCVPSLSLLHMHKRLLFIGFWLRLI